MTWSFQFHRSYYQYKKALKISKAVNRARVKPFYIIGGTGHRRSRNFSLRKPKPMWS